MVKYFNFQGEYVSGQRVLEKPCAFGLSEEENILTLIQETVDDFAKDFT